MANGRQHKISTYESKGSNYRNADNETKKSYYKMIGIKYGWINFKKRAESYVANCNCEKPLDTGAILPEADIF